MSILSKHLFLVPLVLSVPPLSLVWLKTLMFNGSIPLSHNLSVVISRPNFLSIPISTTTAGVQITSICWSQEYLLPVEASGSPSLPIPVRCEEQLEGWNCSVRACGKRISRNALCPPALTSVLPPSDDCCPHHQDGGLLRAKNYGTSQHFLI